MPGIEPSVPAGSSRRRWGTDAAIKTATAATKAAVSHNNRFITRLDLRPFDGAQARAPSRDDNLRTSVDRFARVEPVEARAQTPAAARRAAALSVRSQVNSGSLRPKWPKAAVFR